MDKEKEKIYLTDITLHVRDFRQTINFAKVAQKGRMYSPISSDSFKSAKPTESLDKTGEFEIEINLPKDLQEKLDKGEVELMMPKDGLLMYAGKDVGEKIKQINSKKRNLLIHRGRTWHADERGVE
ncbi:MAG: hypothetical protein RJA61_405 [Candidatus Parcubacteria bacterium]|jgi:hypothetical protein